MMSPKKPTGITVDSHKSTSKLQISTSTNQGATTPQKTSRYNLAPNVNSPIASRDKTPKRTNRTPNRTPNQKIGSPAFSRLLRSGANDDLKVPEDCQGGSTPSKAVFQSSVNLLDCEEDDAQPSVPGQAIFSPAVWRDDSPGASGRSSQKSSKRNSNESTPLKENEKLYQDIEEDYEAYLFMKNIPAIPRHYLSRPAALPPKPADEHEYTLVLDLDETLVHCSVESMEKYEMIFPVNFNGANYQVFMRRRPYFTKFLEAVSKKFEVVVFTASQPAYADKLLDIVDPEKRLIKHRLFRNSCVCVDGNYIKDLRVLGRDLTKTVLVDNSPQAFGYQIDNGIPILSWFDDDNDRELLKLIPIVCEMRKHKDIRTYLQKSFGLTQMIKNLPEHQSVGLQYY